MACHAASGSALACGTGRQSRLFYSILNMAYSIYTNGAYEVIPTDCQPSAVHSRSVCPDKKVLFW